MGFNVTDVWTSSPLEKEMGKSDVYEAIKKAASSSGVDHRELMQLAQIESNFDPKAVSKQGYRGLLQLDPRNYPPFNPSRLDDPYIGAELGAEEYKKIKDDTFLKTVIRHNQGNKGGGEILAAHSSGRSIKAELLDPDKIAERKKTNANYAPAPWNRTRKVLNNLSDKSLNELADKHGLSSIKKVGDRELLIYSMVGDTRNPKKNIVVDDPLVVSLYMDEQKAKVRTSETVVDKILKEM